MDLQGKVCLVTGASGGIGEALAYDLATEGAKVVLFARREQLLKQALAKIGDDDAAMVAGDVSDADDVQRAVQTAVDRFGGLDVLINNAGVAIVGKLSDVPLDLVDRGWRTNVLGVILAIQAATPEIRKRGGGMIVNVSSGMSMRPSPTMGVYSMTKAAVNVISASLREELKDENIKVMTVHPGFIANDFGLNSLAADEDLIADRRTTSRIRSTRTSEDASRDIIAAIKADRDVFRSNMAQAAEVPL